MAPGTGVDPIDGPARLAGAGQLGSPRHRRLVASTADVLTLVALLTILVIALAGDRRSGARSSRTGPGPVAGVASRGAGGGPRSRGRRRTRLAAGLVAVLAVAALGLAGAAVTRADGHGTVLAAPAAVRGRAATSDATGRDPAG